MYNVVILTATQEIGLVLVNSGRIGVNNSASTRGIIQKLKSEKYNLENDLDRKELTRWWNDLCQL